MKPAPRPAASRPLGSELESFAHRSSSTGPAADGGAGALTLGIICGMAAEARALGHWRGDPRVAIAVSGGRPELAEAGARRLTMRGVRALLSWGIAGALDPALAPGTLIVPDRVLCPDGTIHALAVAALDLPGACAAAHDHSAVPGPTAGTGRSRPPPPSGGRDGEGAAMPAAARDGKPPPAARGLLVAGSDTLLLDPAPKAALRRRNGAAAVDMESHRVAAVAAEAGLPCIVIRAVSDPANRALPALAAAALDTRGRPRPGAVLAGLLRRPGDLPALLRAAGDSRAALAALRRAADPVVTALLAGLPGAR